MKVKVFPLKDVEYKSLQYFAGFVIRKLYSSLLQQEKEIICFMISVVVCFKLVRLKKMKSQTLVNARDRGGLWKVNIKHDADIYTL